MLSRLLKPPSKESKRKGGKDDFKDACNERSTQVRQEDISSPRTPGTPRLERGRNLRWHLVELNIFEDVPRRSVSSYSAASDNSRHEPLSPTLSESISLDDVENKRMQRLLTPLESSPENASNRPFSHSNCLSQSAQLHAFDKHNDGYGTSSEYSAGSSNGSPPKVTEDIRAGLTRNVALPITPRARKRQNTPRRLQANGSEKIMTVSNHPSSQERMEVLRPGSPLLSPTKVPSETEKGNLTSPLVSPRTSDYRRPISHQGKELAGTKWVQELVDRSPYQSPVKSPLQSPRRSPLSSPRTPSRAISPQRYPFAHHDDLQNAHPLPLPSPPSAAPVSPRSWASSADRSEDSGRVDSPLASTRWSRSPGRADVTPLGGKWSKGSLLGSGSFGKVYRGHHSETGDMCAIKEVEYVPDDPRSKESAKQLAQEVKFLSMLRHPNILHYKGSEMVGERLYIYLELVSGGSIYKLLQEFNSFNEPVIRRYTRQILLGLQYLHGKNTVHRDIKCANLLVDQDGTIKLADFGMAKLIGKETAPLSFKGSPYWMAPEVILQNNTGFEWAVDIWSLGCTVIEMATGKPPWFQYEGPAAMFKVMNCHDVPIPTALSAVGQDFVSLCLQRDPAKRPSATALLEHPFVQIDKFPNISGQSVQSLMERRAPKESDGLGNSPFMASRDCAQPTVKSPNLSSGAGSPRPSRLSQMPTSRSALQLSEYSRLRPVKGRKGFGQLTDTEDYVTRYEGSPVNHFVSSNRKSNDFHGPHATENEMSVPYSPRR